MQQNVKKCSLVSQDKSIDNNLITLMYFLKITHLT